ncbi:MAG TPA: DUF192 domain-containing protein [Ottowia sp.]|uniref:DUF192 domain-containing protein n=1 Tax=Ottowia sp. TaxID=1898956 RepID=UPI002C6DECC6|nr:DUF192 domain-containing protein [Ottowia sp.]HMN21053.1 DUF192 domain-containing protein [Ottowia sp.]
MLLRLVLPLVLLATTALSAPASAAAPAGTPQLDLPRTTLAIGMYRIDAQVAASFEQRQIGLMHRREMPQHEGMLFVFEQAGVQCFWMKNTLIPLTAAFVADDGRIVNLADMQPLDEASHCSAEPVRYVLEMNQGWFASRRIAPGHRLRGPMFKAP